MKKDSIKFFIILQVGVLIYSLVSVVSKTASSMMKNYGLFSVPFILCVGGMFALLGIYAIIWQFVLKKLDLSIAYSNKGITLLWSMVWSLLFFGEKITFNNILGILLIIIGIVVVNSFE